MSSPITVLLQLVLRCVRICPARLSTFSLRSHLVACAGGSGEARLPSRSHHAGAMPVSSPLPEVCLPRAWWSAGPFPGRLQPGRGRPVPWGALVIAHRSSRAASRCSAALTNTVKKIQLLLNVLFLSCLQSISEAEPEKARCFSFLHRKYNRPWEQSWPLLCCHVKRAALVHFAQCRLSRPPGPIPGCLLLPAELCFLPFGNAKQVSPLAVPRAWAGLFVRSRSSCAKWSGQTASCEDIVHLLQARHEYPHE